MSARILYGTMVAVGALALTGPAPAQDAFFGTTPVAFDELLTAIDRPANNGAAYPENIWDGRWRAMLLQLRTLSAADGREHGFLIYTMMNAGGGWKTSPITAGRAALIQLQDVMPRTADGSLDPAAKYLVLAHSHPNYSSFSYGDLENAYRKGHATIVVDRGGINMAIREAGHSESKLATILLRVLGNSAWADRETCEANEVGWDTAEGQRRVDVYMRMVIALVGMRRWYYDAGPEVWVGTGKQDTKPLVDFIQNFHAGLSDATRMAIATLGYEESRRRLADGTFGDSVRPYLGADFKTFASRTAVRNGFSQEAARSADQSEWAMVSPRYENRRCTTGTTVNLLRKGDTRSFVSYRIAQEGDRVTARPIGV